MSEQSRWLPSDIKGLPILIGDVFCESCGTDVTDGPVSLVQLEKILRAHRLTCARE